MSHRCIVFMSVHGLQWLTKRCVFSESWHCSRSQVFLGDVDQSQSLSSRRFCYVRPSVKKVSKVKYNWNVYIYNIYIFFFIIYRCVIHIFQWFFAYTFWMKDFLSSLERSMVSKASLRSRSRLSVQTLRLLPPSVNKNVIYILYMIILYNQDYHVYYIW